VLCVCCCCWCCCWCCSLDGKRLYITNSLLSPWDKQFYPEMVAKVNTAQQLSCWFWMVGFMLVNMLCTHDTNS
jgi:hypothetical protein